MIPLKHETKSLLSEIISQKFTKEKPSPSPFREIMDFLFSFDLDDSFDAIASIDETSEYKDWLKLKEEFIKFNPIESDGDINSIRVFTDIWSRLTEALLKDYDVDSASNQLEPSTIKFINNFIAEFLCWEYDRAHYHNLTIQQFASKVLSIFKKYLKKHFLINGMVPPHQYPTKEHNVLDNTLRPGFQDIYFFSKKFCQDGGLFLAIERSKRIGRTPFVETFLQAFEFHFFGNGILADVDRNPMKNHWTNFYNKFIEKLHLMEEREMSILQTINTVSDLFMSSIDHIEEGIPKMVKMKIERIASLKDKNPYDIARVIYNMEDDIWSSILRDIRYYAIIRYQYIFYIVNIVSTALLGQYSPWDQKQRLAYFIMIDWNLPPCIKWTRATSIPADKKNNIARYLAEIIIRRSEEIEFCFQDVSIHNFYGWRYSPISKFEPALSITEW